MLKIYKASAGSGKTYKLAYEYIRALLGFKPEGDKFYRLCTPKYVKASGEMSNRHRHILAITFTNKATEEMKRRIINELDALTIIPSAGQKDSNYASDLCKEFGCSREELREVAAHALRQLLHDYSSFNVTTIDSFFQRVLRTFARELDKQGDFDVELNDILAVQSSVGTMIDDFNTDPQAHKLLGKWIYDYMCERLDQGQKANFFNRRSQIFTSLVALVANICEEQFKDYAIPMKQVLSDTTKMPKLKKAIKAKEQGIINEIKQESCRVWNTLNANGVTIDKINGRLKVKTLFSDYFNTGIAVPNISNDIFGSTYTKILNGESKLFSDKQKVDSADIDTIISLLAWIRQKYADYVILQDIYKALDHLILLGYAWPYLDSFVKENNIVLLSETNHLLKRIIGNDDTPFIYERMGVQFQHFLIDEFQDTSKMQWENLKHLVNNGLSIGKDSLIIGDEKQSIYRFRNSDSSLLHYQVAEVDFPNDTNIEGSNPGENTNWRSAANVVKFNNTLFTHLSKALDIEGYDNVIQDIPKKHLDLEGRVEFVPFLKPKKKRKGAEVEDTQDEESETDSIELDALAKNILRQHDEGKYPWSDIAILVATHLNAGKVIDHLITKYPQIPVLSDEALYVRKSPAVQLVIDILEIIESESKIRSNDEKKKKYSDNAEIALAISRYNYYSNHGIPTEEALDMAIRKDRIGEGNLPATLINAINTIKQHKPSSLSALVETIIHELAPQSERTSQISYLTAFQDYVTDYCSHFNPSLRSFLNHWNSAKKRLSISSASNVDAVKVMTIHKSKGLEFDCVHIPFGSWSELGNPSGQWIKWPEIEGIEPEICPPAIYLNFKNHPKCLATPGTYFYADYIKDEKNRYVDTMNMTYVAYTRAGRELTVYYNPAEGIGKYISAIFANPGYADVNDYRLCNLYKHYDPTTYAFVLGDVTHKEAEKKADEDPSAIIQIKDYDVHFQKDTAILTRAEDMLELEPDASIDTEITAPADTYAVETEAREKGVTLHEILSKIQRPEDIDKAVELARISLRISPKAIAPTAALVKNMLNSDDVRIHRWFVDNVRVLTEQTIYMPAEANGDDNKRPDRIVFNHDGSIDVVDYKFTADTKKSHISQVRGYMRILSDMGYTNIRGYLWYPLMPKIVEVSD